MRDVITNGAKNLCKRIFSPFSLHSSPLPVSPSSLIQASEVFWALKDVSFKVNQGDRIGIIGRNGAGKSTLLKILSRITEPTTGSIRIKGRVASLLEVGTGFHPELTGRENIFLNGAILGMQREEIRRKFDEIVDFSEIEKFLDTPVKRYSSGMYVRLAFAVAAHLEPEILIVDEVLAVGDAQFQKKCLGKMDDVGREGRTVLFVSHNMQAIKALCNRAVLLQKGEVISDNSANGAIAKYLENVSESILVRTWPDANTAPFNDSAVLVSAQILNCSGNIADEILTDTAFDIQLEYRVKSDNAFVGLTINLTDSDNTLVLSSINNRDPKWHNLPKQCGTYRSRCRIPSNLLNNGWYKISLNLFGRNFSDLKNITDLLIIEVQDCQVLRGDYFGEWGGVIRPDLKWTTILESENS